MDFYINWTLSFRTFFLSARQQSRLLELLVSLFILKWKNCQQNPPVTLIVFYILVIHTDKDQMIFEVIKVYQPGGAAINFSKNARNQNQTTLLVKKIFCYP